MHNTSSPATPRIEAAKESAAQRTIVEAVTENPTLLDFAFVRCFDSSIHIRPLRPFGPKTDMSLSLQYISHCCVS